MLKVAQRKAEERSGYWSRSCIARGTTPDAFLVVLSECDENDHVQLLYPNGDKDSWDRSRFTIVEADFLRKSLGEFL